ncbi:transposase [Clostridium sp. OS1-26]|uniref:transposase n=1 Tax=Clostridium sp. OS1-26 TaxID=3070681 RepID=UPI0027E0799C|nr:transposase [Clostridium sp. OS1-26]WML37816.1 transposase [Clostridium sp. OS1-26]
MAKSKWEDVKEKLILVEGWGREGLTDEQIAHNLEIGKTAFYKYKKEHTEFANALKKGKEVIDFEVENALFKRALGYEYQEVTRERTVIKDDKGQIVTDIHGFPCYKMIVVKTVRKEVAPGTIAQIFWLKNRKPEKWRDKQEVQHSGGINTKNPFEGLTKEQLLKLASEDDG